jgi:serine/threonine protein kinase
VRAASLYPTGPHVRCIVVCSVKMAGILRRQATIKKRYSVDYLARLGGGGFGEVYLGQDKDSGAHVAVKVVAAKAGFQYNANDLNRELDIMRNTDHPNLVRLLDDETIDRTSYIILELCKTDLNTFAKEEPEGLSRPLKWQFIKEIVFAIDYLHSSSIVHRDLKPANILVKIEGDRNTLKVSDFGLSKKVDGESSATATAGVGTLYWMAPEIVTDQERPVRELRYGISSDCFAVGLNLHAVVKHRPGEWLTTITGIEAKPKYK